MSYTVTYRPSAARDLEKLPTSLQDRLLARIEALADAPRGPGTKPLKGPLRGLTRLRVGDYRVAYVIDDRAQTVDVLRIGHREAFYA